MRDELGITEIAGLVDRVGEGVTTVREGDRVVVCPIVSCGHCRYCIRGLRNRCANRRTLGYDLDGGFAEYVLLPAEIVRQGHVLRVPDGLPLDVAALTEPAACTLNSIELMQTGRYLNIPVVDDDDCLVGVVRPVDVLSYLAEAFPEALLNLPPRPHQQMVAPEGA